MIHSSAGIFTVKTYNAKHIITAVGAGTVSTVCISVSGPCTEGPPQPLLLPPPVAAPGDEQDVNRPSTLAVAEPPLPPPRKSGHSRSSSLDNNLILGPSDQGHYLVISEFEH